MTDRNFADAQLLDELTAIAARAGARILKVRERAFSTRQKPDATPVTDADHAAEDIILMGLSKALPGVPVVSEEDHARRPVTQAAGTFVLVDPLDGTREFIAGRDEFTVNIALIENETPRVGIIAAPARGSLWRGSARHGAQKLHLTGEGHASDPVTISTRRLDVPRVILMSRSHSDPATTAFAKRWTGIETMTAGSSLKFGLIAEGIADVYPRLAPVREWDAAAGHALVVAAGGIVVTPDGNPLDYGRKENNFTVTGFVAWANPALCDQGASAR